MKDERTLAFINFHAILGALTELCRLSGGKISRSGMNHRLKKIIDAAREDG